MPAAAAELPLAIAWPSRDEFASGHTRPVSVSTSLAQDLYVLCTCKPLHPPDQRIARGATMRDILLATRGHSKTLLEMESARPNLLYQASA